VEDTPLTDGKHGSSSTCENKATTSYNSNDTVLQSNCKTTAKRTEPNSETDDDDLKAVVDAWPQLSKIVKTGIVAMVEASTGE